MQNDSTQPIDIPKLNNSENEKEDDDNDEDDNTDDEELSCESDNKFKSLLELNSPIKRAIRKKKKKKELKKNQSRTKLVVRKSNLVNSACYMYDQEEDLTNSLQESQQIFDQKMNEECVQSEKVVFNRSLSVDPFDRDRTKLRIENLLRLALRNTHKSQLHAPPPPTPLSSSLPHCINSPRPSFQTMISVDQSDKAKHSDNIWKELFDYFDFYNDRAKSMQELDERIEKKRSEIPQKINIILNLDYSRIKQVMDDDIKKTMFSILDYSKLYENKIYIDQLCYLNLLIQDDLNNICYIESLYPSIRCLKNDQALYADPKFETTAKTLLLWHKIVKDLMLKSDQLGRFLGFAKRPEYLEHWNWFEQRLNYSRSEYEKVQEWLNVNLSTSQSSATLVNSPTNHSPDSSPLIVLREPTYTSLPPNQSETNIFLRQISYLIKRPNEAHMFDHETFKSSLSFNFLSSRNSPESLNFQQEHLIPVIVHHVDSFIKNSAPRNSPDPSPQSNDEVKFTLNEADDEENEETDAEEEQELKSLSEVSSTSLIKDNRKKLFREFLRKRLRKFGLTKTCDKIREVVLTSLSHALLALQIDKCEKSAIKQLTDYHLIPLHYKCREMIQGFYHDEESVKFGVQSEAFTRLGLPSYRPLFIYLNNVILELMHLCIEMQNENKGAINQHLESKFSLLSIEVLTNECRECIEQAILVRQFYYHMIYSVFDLNEMDVQQQLEKDLYKFDDDLKRTITIYLDFITNWVQDLVRVSNFSKALWVLDNEWNFCKNNLYFVTATEDIYASRFCNMGIHVYESLINMFNIIDNKYKEPLRIEIDTLFWDERYKLIGVDLTSISLSVKDEQTLNTESDEDQYDQDEFLTRQTSCSSNEKLNLNFNEFKEEINKFKKFCLRTLDFTAEFLADLELAAKYELVHDLQALLDKLYTTNHVLVNFTNLELLNDSAERSFLIFVPQEFAKDKIQIVRLLFIISEKDSYESKEANLNGKSVKSDVVRRLSSSNSIFDPFADNERDTVLRKLSEFAQKIAPTLSAGSSPAQSQKNAFIISPSQNTNGYLLYLKLNDLKEKWTWKGQKIDLHASRPVRLSLYHHLNPKVTDSEKKILYLITSKQSILTEKKIIVKQKLQGSISLIKEKASFHPSIDESITDLKDKIYELRKICMNWIKSIESDLIPNLSGDPNSFSLTKIERNVNEILRVSYIFGIELQNDIIKFLTQNRAKSFAQGLAEFSIQWCDYIVSKTDRGKGRTTRPWAANKGLHLVQVAVAHSVHLSSWDFSRLVQAIERCFSHLIGDQEQDSDYLLKPLNRNISSSSRSLNFTAKISNKTLPPRKRFEDACLEFDKKIETKRFEDRSIGKILDLNRQDWIIAGTEVQFRWQLGLLIGEGSFGKVYSCVNLDTWEPMALKIIEFKNNTDVQNLQEIADEINNVVDICHENLVKVYGSELHRKEIFIFMEFCGDQCTLDRLSRDASGLPENLVRKYTKSLLKGVEHLHEKNIIHRDIKGANIFLKSIDNRHPEKVVLKLGDFGCSIRLKDPIGTASRDQATGLRGTYAFMAPEVMASGGVKDEGYTYSADIWSVGCVVIEMFTGKRPWHPLKDEAILFKVHLSTDSDKKPSYPVPISDEANHFLNCCFEFEPDKRLLADQLLELSFVKIVDDDTVYD